MNNLSARALAIIEILKKLSHPVSSLALSEEIGCSTKTIQSEIKDINKQLKDTKIVSIRGVGYKLEGKIEVDKCINNNIGNIDRIEFIIKTMLNLNLEKDIRNSKINFGLITYRLKDFKPLELFKEDMKLWIVSEKGE